MIDPRTLYAMSLRGRAPNAGYQSSGVVSSPTLTTASTMPQPGGTMGRPPVRPMMGNRPSLMNPGITQQPMMSIAAPPAVAAADYARQFPSGAGGPYKAYDFGRGGSPLAGLHLGDKAFSSGSFGAGGRRKK